LGTHYGKLRVDVAEGKSFVVSIGDIVHFKAQNGELPYIAVVRDLWCDKNDQRWVRGSWYFRKSDISRPHRGLISHDSPDNEIFMSPLIESNRVQCIVSLCEVVYGDGSDPLSPPTWAAPFGVYYCRFMYTPKNSKNPFRPLIVEDFPPPTLQVFYHTTPLHQKKFASNFSNTPPCAAS
jgi:hypothetical protein